MKVSREEAGANRERIIEVASRLFREKGLDGIGVADLMKGAGLTHGGFYGHFKSKDDLAAHAAERALQRSNARWAELIEKSKGDSFAVVAKGYLSEEHRDKLGSGCAFAALGADAARQGRSFRQVFTDGLNTAIGILSGIVSGRSKADRRKHALAAMSQMVGALVLSRAVDDRDLANEILRAALDDLVGRNAAGSDV